MTSDTVFFSAFLRLLFRFAFSNRGFPDLVFSSSLLRATANSIYNRLVLTMSCGKVTAYLWVTR